MTTQLQEQNKKSYTIFNDELCIVDDSRQDQSLALIGLDSGVEYKIDKCSVKDASYAIGWAADKAIVKVLDKFEMTFKDASYVIDWIADNLVLTHDEAETMYRIQAKLKTEAKWKALLNRVK